MAILLPIVGFPLNESFASPVVSSGLIKELDKRNDLHDIQSEGKSSKTIRLVVWQPPLPYWVKVNTDGASKGNPGLSACEGVFIASACEFLGAFAVPLGTQCAYYTELMGVFMAVHIAHANNWRRLWIGSDSSIVVQAIQRTKLDPPEALEPVWKNIQRKMDSMNIRCSHIYREGNRMADKLANLGLKYPSLHMWGIPPEEIQELLKHDACGLPNYRICKSRERHFHCG
ncbi:hypothetical protein Pint_36456 [Pistacia integerrima]|uniref:Uncharacterized protein n=1 Tax=Pistacia integerrima TaxID=434235 RepID=A0ACC0XZJ8_9ROSI|nr:hypothetical protein Pint_36456 [Pistacia integerrima]